MRVQASRRDVAPGHEVKLGSRWSNPNELLEDEYAWIEVLRRPPETWSPTDVAQWAQRPRAECGGQLGYSLSQRLWENAVDGQLLLLYGSSGDGGRGGHAQRILGWRLSNTLGISDSEQRRAIAVAIEELRTLQDRILYGDVVLPPPRELTEQLAPPAAVSDPGATDRRRSRPAARKQTGPLNGGVATVGDWQANRFVGLTGKERILLDAKKQAAAAAAAAAAAVVTTAREDQAGPCQRDGRGAGPRRVAGAGEGDVGQLSDQAHVRTGGEASTQVVAGTETARDVGGGQREAGGGGELLGGLRKMVELVEAHDDVVRRLHVLRLGGPSGLARFQDERRRAAEDAAAAELAAAQAAAAAAAKPPTALKFEEVEERGRRIRQRAAAQAMEVDELARVPLRRALRHAAARAETQAAAAGDSGDATGGEGGAGGSGGEGFAGVGAAPVLRGGWREVDDSGADVGEDSVRQSLSSTGRELLEDANRRDAATSYPDPWVYDDDDDNGDEEGSARRGHSRIGARRRGAGIPNGGNVIRDGDDRRKQQEEQQDEADQRRRGVQRQLRAQPWVVPDLRGSDGGADAGGVGAFPAAAASETHRPASARRELRGGGAHSGGPALRPLAGLPRGRGQEPGSWEVHPPRPAADPWLTADQRAVRRVLETGASTPVHHTLKSKLASDAVRHMYGITSRGARAPSELRRGQRRPANAGPGPLAEAAAAVAVPFFPPASLLNNERAAAHEVHLRRHMCVPVPLDLSAARSVAVSREAKRLVAHPSQDRAPEESEPDALLTEAVEGEDGSVTFASRYGFQGAPSPNAPSAAPEPQPQPHPTALHSPRSPSPAVGSARPPSRFAQEAAKQHQDHPPGHGWQPYQQQWQPRGLQQGPGPTHHRQQEPQHKPRQGAVRFATTVTADPAAPLAAFAGRAQLGPVHAASGGSVRQRPASASTIALPFTELAQITTGAFPLASARELQLEREQDEPRHGQGHQPEPARSGPDLASPGAGHVRVVVAAQRGLAEEVVQDGRLAPSKAHARGIGWDEDLKRLTEARVAAARVAVVAKAAADAVEGGQGGGGRLGVARPTSAARARGMVRIGASLEGQWGDPELQHSLRKALRLLDGDEALEEVWGPVGRAGSAGLRRRGEGGGGGGAAQLTEPGESEWAAQIYRFKRGELVYTGRRPPFSAKPEPQYEVPGMHPRPMGQSWTKQDAERLAGAVSADVRGNTELHWAASRGDAVGVRELLEAAGGPEERAALANRRNQSGETPLHRAAMCRGPRAAAAMEYLLAAGADTDPRDVNGATPLMCIFTSECWLPEGDRRARTLLAAGARVDMCDSSGETLLHKAIIHTVCRGAEATRQRSSLADLFKLLLMVGRKQRPAGHQSPCAIQDSPGAGAAAGYSRRQDPLNTGGRAAESPARAGVGSGARGGSGSKAIIAVGGGRPSSAEGSSSRVSDFAQAHPLAAAAAVRTSGALPAAVVAAAAAATAAAGGRPPAGRQAPSSSAVLSIDACDGQGRTALHIACSRPHFHAPGMVGCCVSVLLQEGADPDAIDDGGRRPLHLVLAGAVEAVRLQEANRINHTKLATARPKMPPSAMCWVAEQLLRAGADPSAPEEATGYTPLHLAALARSRPLLQLLLRLGADPRVRDKAGTTAGDVLRGVLRVTKDRDEERLVDSLVQEIQKYEQAIEIAASGSAPAAAGAGAAVGGFGSLGLSRRAWASGHRGAGRRSDKPGLGGGAGPKTMRQLYRERFKPDSSEEDEEEQADGPTQQELVQAYMAAMRSGRLGPLPAPHVLASHGLTASPAEEIGAAAAAMTDGTSLAAAGDRGAARRPAAAATAAARMDPNLAATKIQAAFRGHRTRRELRRAGFPVLRRLPKPPPAAPLGDAAGTFTPRLPYGLDHQRAAVKIQAAFRDHRARKRSAKKSGRGAASAAQQQQAEQAGRARPAPPQPTQPAVLGLNGLPYGPEDVRAATRIQASWKGRKARKLYERVRHAAAEEYDDDLGLDDEEIQALAHSAGRGRRALTRTTTSPRGAEGAGGAAGAANADRSGSAGGEGGGSAPEASTGEVPEGSKLRPSFGSEGGTSDNAPPSVGGWSVASTAVSHGAESFQAPEAPPQRHWRPLAHGSDSTSFGRAAGATAMDGGVSTGAWAPLERSEAGASLSFRQRGEGSRRVLVIPEVTLTPDGQIQGDVGDLDMLDLDDDGGDDGDEGGEWPGDDQGGPSVLHDDDADSVF